MKRIDFLMKACMTGLDVAVTEAQELGTPIDKINKWTNVLKQAKLVA
jgi:hypothetical protein